MIPGDLRHTGWRATDAAICRMLGALARLESATVPRVLHEAGLPAGGFGVQSLLMREGWVESAEGQGREIRLTVAGRMKLEELEGAG